MLSQLNKNKKASFEDRQKEIETYLDDFRRRFPTEEAAIDELYARAARSKVGISCSSCRNRFFRRAPGQRKMRCLRCCRVQSFTAGTFLDRVRKLYPYLFCLWLLETGKVLNACEFARLMKSSISNASYTLKKVALVAACKLADFEQYSLVPSSSLLAIYCRRSGDTPRREHPQTEVDSLDQFTDFNESPQASQTDESARNTSKVYDSYDRTTGTEVTQPVSKMVSPLVLRAEHELVFPKFYGYEEKTVFDLLSGVPMSFDTLVEKTNFDPGTLIVALELLKDEGFAKSPFTEQFVRADCFPDRTELSKNARLCIRKESRADVSSALKFIRAHFRFVSRKCVQLYLAIQTLLRNRTENHESLSEQCFNLGVIRFSDVRNYVSPEPISI